MGKVRQIYIWNGRQDLGPFRREELIDQLKAGRVLPSDYYFEEGMADWAHVANLPCCRVILATEAQKQMLTSMGIQYDDFLTKSDVSRIMENQPASERQIALLNYLGLQAPPGVTKTKASEMLEEAGSNPSFGERLDHWSRDRLDIYPNLYASERTAFKAERADLLLEEYDRFRADMRESGTRLRKITLEDIKEAISRLDVHQSGWDKDIRLTGLDFLLPELERVGPL